MSDWKLVDVPVFADKKRGGVLAVAEVFKTTGNIFDSARRVYCVINTENRVIKRGGHYHPTGGKQEFWLVPIGRVDVELHGPERCRKKLILNKNTQALLIPSNVWHAVKIYPGSALVSVASTNFDPSEAITDLPPCACKK